MKYIHDCLGSLMNEKQLDLRSQIKILDVGAGTGRYSCLLYTSVISKEIKEQMLEKEHRLPDAVIACVGGGSNAIGSFYNFIEDEGVELIGCEAAGRGIDTFETAATEMCIRDSHYMLRSEFLQKHHLQYKHLPKVLCL